MPHPLSPPSHGQEALLRRPWSLEPSSCTPRKPSWACFRRLQQPSCCCLPPQPSSQLGRRTVIGLGLGTPLVAAFPLLQRPSMAADDAFKQYTDNFDGYSFSYPQGWIQVRGAGADIFFRDPVNLDENVSVEISSPSSSRFKQVDDLGSPDQAAQKVLQQYLTEFMSTRLGVRRESRIVSTGCRVAEDGKLYYDIEVNVKSYANNQQLAVMPQDRISQLEWDRRYLSVLGVENNRLYELRLQAPEKVLVKEEGNAIALDPLTLLSQRMSKCSPLVAPRFDGRKVDWQLRVSIS